MTAIEFELVLRAVTATLLVLVAIGLLRLPGPAPRLGALFCGAVLAFVLTSFTGAEAIWGAAALPLTLLCVSKGAAFWLFVRALFHDGFIVAGRHYALLAGTALYGGWQQLVHVPRVPAGSAGPWETTLGLGFEALVMGFALLALGEAWRGLAGDLIERRRRLRVAFVAAGGAYLAVVAATQGANLLFAASTPSPLRLANLALMTVLAAAVLATLYAPRAPSWLRDIRRDAAPAPLTPVEAALLPRLRRAMEDERLYRDDTLTIAGLAQRLGTQERLLRRTIHRGLGHRNFSEFLHAYRIGEACRRPRAPADARRPVLSIALDVGYASIGPFNRAFKARTGMTPTAFRRGAES